MTSDVVNATTVYYTPYVGGYIPIQGTNYFFSQLTLTLNSSIETAGYIYDIYAFSTGSAVQIGINPTPWYNLTTRGATYGAAIQQSTSGATIGLWVNSYGYPSFSFYNGLTPYHVTSGAATYLGSIYMTGNGETSAQFKPTPAAGGTGNVIGLYNAYNRVPFHSLNTDSTASWTDTNTSAWVPADSGINSGQGNRITWLDGLQQTQVKAKYATLTQATPDVTSAYIGISLDTAPNPNLLSVNLYGTAANWAIWADVEESFLPQSGLHFVQAMNLVQTGGSSPTATFFGSGYQAFILDGEY